ncbi:MAG: poly-gamma-glutamate synthase PgsB [Erysipelothrix sp.]
MELYIITVSLIFFIIMGVAEKRKNDKNIEQIPIRINVNGIRGKSTITRMITSVLAEAGYNTVGKTTGTAPRIINNQLREEIEIVRRPKGVSISEQIDVIDYAKNKEAEALVCECMAVNPDYQKVYQESMIQANIGVIINVLEDHLDLMGPSLDEIALAFSTTIPKSGTVIVQNNEYLSYFKKEAYRKNARVIVADENEIPEGYLEKFNFVVFPNNVAITLAVAKSLGIEKDVALSGMLEMNPDPGTLTIDEINDGVSRYTFANGFAVNDPSSALEIWDMLLENVITDQSQKPIILFNGRPDRVDRSEQFAEDFFSKIDTPFDAIIIGESLNCFETLDELKEEYNITDLKIFDSVSTQEVISQIGESLDGRFVFGVGNIHGHGYDFLEHINRYKIDMEQIYEH